MANPSKHCHNSHDLSKSIRLDPSNNCQLTSKLGTWPLFARQSKQFGMDFDALTNFVEADGAMIHYRERLEKYLKISANFSYSFN